MTKPVLKSFFHEIEKRAQALRGIVALPESLDERILLAARDLVVKGLAGKVFLFGEPARITAAARAVGIDMSTVEHAWKYVSYETCVDFEKELMQFRKAQLAAKGRDESDETLRAAVASPLFQAGYLLNKGDVQSVVAGCMATTADVIRAALQTVGTAPGIKTVSGSFLMTRSLEGASTETFVFADCGVVIDPTSEQLADIAHASVTTFRQLCPATPPRVAFLSFSTKGSASHPHVDKVKRAAEIFRASCPDVASDGELQFDAAYVEAVGKRKAPGSAVAGKANCFIFPNLDSGNIAYKMAQRLGGFAAIGPLLQGTAKPFSDLSRGASADDIVMAACLNMLRGA